MALYEDVIGAKKKGEKASSGIPISGKEGGEITNKDPQAEQLKGDVPMWMSDMVGRVANVNEQSVNTAPNPSVDDITSMHQEMVTEFKKHGVEDGEEKNKTTFGEALQGQTFWIRWQEYARTYKSFIDRYKNTESAAQQKIISRMQDSVQRLEMQMGVITTYADRPLSDPEIQEGTDELHTAIQTMQQCNVELNNLITDFKNVEVREKEDAALQKINQSTETLRKIGREASARAESRARVVDQLKENEAAGPAEIEKNESAERFVVQIEAEEEAKGNSGRLESTYNAALAAHESKMKKKPWWSLSKIGYVLRKFFKLPLTPELQFLKEGADFARGSSKEK